MDIEDKIKESFVDWLKHDETKLMEVFGASDEHWMKFMQQEMEEIESEVLKEPEKAYSHLLSLVGFSCRATKDRPRTASLLTSFLRKFKDILGKIKTALGAESFSITFSIPFDVSVSLTFS